MHLKYMFMSIQIWRKTVTTTAVSTVAERAIRI
jgi:hypothetical protein